MGTAKNGGGASGVVSVSLTCIVSVDAVNSVHGCHFVLVATEG